MTLAQPEGVGGVFPFEEFFIAEGKGSGLVSTGSDLFDEFLPAATSALVLGGGGATTAVGFLDSAIDLLGDLLDPFVPGGAGSEKRFTAGVRGTGSSAIATARARAAGLIPRRRRRKALTNDDVKLALTIASAISKKAAENFILVRVRGS